MVSNKLQDIFKVQKCREGGEGLDGVLGEGLDKSQVTLKCPKM